jgi:hypothetical protein
MRHTCAMSDGPIRVVIADDHAVVRSGLRMLGADLEAIPKAAPVDARDRDRRAHGQKTRLNSRAELVRYTIDQGLIST